VPTTGPPNQGVVPSGPSSSTLEATAAIPPPPRPWSKLVPAEPVTASFGGVGNQYIFDTVGYGDGYIAVGEEALVNGPVDGAIWISPDGIRWERLSTRDNDLANAEIEVVAASGRHLVALGRPRPEEQDTIVWASDDGRSWRRGDGSAFGDAVSRGVADGPAGFIAWADEGRRSELLHSDDGSAWTAIETGTMFDGASIASIKSFRGGFVAVGARLPPPDDASGVGGLDRSAALAWWSADGRAWEATAIDVGFGLSDLQVGADGMMALGSGGCGGCIGPAAMWRSTDGRSWSHDGDDARGWPLYGSNGARIIRDDWQGDSTIYESKDGREWTQIGSHARTEVYGLTIGAHGILITQSITRHEAPDEVDAGVWFLAAE
jgi:hypothetical protein